MAAAAMGVVALSLTGPVRRSLSGFARPMVPGLCPHMSAGGLPTLTGGASRSGSSSIQRRAVEDTDTMGALFTKYYRLQEINANLEADTKVAVVKDLLEVLDDLERALQTLEADTPAHGAVRVVTEKFERKLLSLGFTRMETLGTSFDPQRHEAASKKDADGYASDMVCEEFRSGWFLGERVVRPAVVAVAA
eukprot:CAMPEP_0170575306 /NCGR_PEP_ID=MMETSP0224-20130122/3794_1 /TAXON_ID=285029 /ORGANISM="Togula jolla, Strain CCCM 725" /LENGTH=191 /DNA_ID=CAMNT_0010898083 /DNA_START=31 /DNA_END=606 /DNA_ORIENTATION=+